MLYNVAIVATETSPSPLVNVVVYVVLVDITSIRRIHHGDHYLLESQYLPELG
jgi:hypothetical protein